MCNDDVTTDGVVVAASSMASAGMLLYSGMLLVSCLL